MGHVITFAQQKGGAGKTTMAAHLAAAWAEAGRSVALVDLDPQQSLTRWAKLRADPAIEVIESKDYRAAGDLRSAKRTHDFVLVDCPGAASSLLESAMRESDLVVAPCQPSVMDVWALESVVATAARLRRPVRILLNRMPARLGSLDEVLGALGDSRALLLASQIGNRNGFSRAMLSGRTAPELAPRGEESSIVRRSHAGLLATTFARSAQLNRGRGSGGLAAGLRFVGILTRLGWDEVRVPRRLATPLALAGRAER